MENCLLLNTLSVVTHCAVVTPYRLAGGHVDVALVYVIQPHVFVEEHFHPSNGLRTGTSHVVISALICSFNEQNN